MKSISITNSASPAGIAPKLSRFFSLQKSAASLLALLGIAGALHWMAQGIQPKSADYKTTRLQARNIQQVVEASGVVDVQTGYEVKIGSQISGRIQRLYATLGQNVQAGQIIAKLDLPELNAQLKQARASLSTAVTRLQQQQAGMGLQETQDSTAVAQAEQDVQSNRSLLQQAQLTNHVQPLQTRATLQQAEAAMKSAKYKLALIQRTTPSQIAAARAAIAKTEAADLNAHQDLERQTTLFKKGFVAQSVRDAAQATALSADADLNSAKQQEQTLRLSLLLQKRSAAQDLKAAQAALAGATAQAQKDAALQMAVAQQQNALAKAREQLALARAGTVQNRLKQQDIEAARQAVQIAQAQVQYYQALKAKDSIATPISGTVLQLASQQGETVAAGLSAPTLIVVANLHKLQMDAYVDETDIGRVGIGMPVQIVVDSFPNRTFHGVVTNIAPSATLQQNVITYLVTCSFQHMPACLRPDMTGSVQIMAGVHKNTLTVPVQAIHWDSQGPFIYLLKHNRVCKTGIHTGATQNGYTQISGSLHQGDLVVTAGYKPEKHSSKQSLLSVFTGNRG